MARASWSLLLLVVLGMPSSAQDGYQTAPDPLGAIVDTPMTPVVRLSPDLRWGLLTEYPSMLPLAELAEPELRLAGMRFKPTVRGPSRVLYGTRLTLRNLTDLSERVVTGPPAGQRMGFASWSPDGQRIAFSVNDGTGFTLWVADVETAVARHVPQVGQLNAVGGTPYLWLPDSRSLVCLTVPKASGAGPVDSSLPTGPVIQENLGRSAPARTYQDLLKNPHDEALFEHYQTSQLVRTNLQGETVLLGEPAMVSSLQASPDGNYLLVEAIRRPFSYTVPVSRFPRRVEIWDRHGKLVRRLADLPLHDQVPIAFGSVPTGPRSHNWRSDAPSTVVWVEALDGGDAGKESELRDKVWALASPFDQPPSSLIELALRYGGVQWGHDQLALVSEWWWSSRTTRTWIIDPADSTRPPRVLWDRSWEDRYGDPGSPLTHTNAAGHEVLVVSADRQSLFLSGDGASPEGDRPFLDRLDLQTLAARRLFQSEAPHYEAPVAMLDDQGRQILTRRESVDDPPNYFLRTLAADPGAAPTGDAAGDDLLQITHFPHPSPQLKGLRKEILRYDRADGVKLTATLYLPPGYKSEDGPLPLVMWAYPQEFKSADAAGQVTNSPYRFDRVSWASPLLFLTRGYALLDDPAMPIVGEGDVQPNDTYMHQLVSSAQAAVDEVVRLGVADRDRIAVGGHSYGAFMTANLLAHSDLFRAGIARSGAYNRTLTPFGFQSEERTIWQAPEIYSAMSPFMHADKINEPLLLIHGEADNNAGTYPMQSERMYNALAGLGGTSRLVMLPLESHGYQARESIHHMLWEMSTWLDRYVKNAEPRESSNAAANPSDHSDSTPSTATEP